MAQKLSHLPITATAVVPLRDAVPDAVLARCQALYDQGLYVQAYAEAMQHADPLTWRGPRALIFVSRLAHNLGAPRAANARALAAFRALPADAEALYYAASTMLSHRGPLIALAFLDRHEPKILASAPRKADLWALRARIHSYFRDFDQAHAALDAARQLAPESAWVAVETSSVLRFEDRYEDSLLAARRAAELQPGYRPAVQALAQALGLLGRNGEALEVLEAARQKLESGAVALQTVDLFLEARRYEDAERAYAEYETHSPMMEAPIRAWLAGARARLHYLQGDRERAAKEAQEAGGYFFEKMAKNLAAVASGATRVELDVPFLRQKHMTCAPTCLAMLARFFGRAADQEAITAAICYDGTEDHKERAWAEANGYAVREFSVDWPTTRALIDAGVPFCLNTQETASAHLQIVMGYDAVLGMLLIRDPYNKSVGEFLAEEFFERYRDNGPRGMVMIPTDQAAKIQDVAFHDEALFDLRFRFRRALSEHRRPDAGVAAGEAEKLDAKHWLTRSMMLEKARYDADHPTVLAITEELYTRNPRNKRYLHHRLATLREHAKQETRIALLTELAAKRDCEAVFLVSLADELRQDRTRLDEAEALLHRALRQRYDDGATYWYLAEIKRVTRRFAEACPLARIAACLDDKNEFLASAYFNAARNASADGEGGKARLERALKHLEWRVGRLGDRSAGPARTLHTALLAVERRGEAKDVLEQALARRSQDGELMLYAADAYARIGQKGRAQELLARAEGHVSALEYHEALATNAQLYGERQVALTQWKKVAELNPQSTSAHNRVAGLIDKMQNRKQALRYIEAVVARQPDNRFFRKMHVEWLRDHDSPELGDALAKLIEVWPKDAWARREQALYFAGENRFAEAERALAAARDLDPDGYGYHFSRGYVHRLAGELEQAVAAYLTAMERDVDSSYAVSQALRAATTTEDKARIVRRHAELLAKHKTEGDGLLHFRDHALEHLQHAEALSLMRELKTIHAHLAWAWIALARVLAAGDDETMQAEALAVAGEATRAFPLDASTWIELADLRRKRDDVPGATEALNEALRANPTSGAALRRLAETLERAGDVNAEFAVLTNAIERQPFDATNLGYLADCLWRKGDKETAVTRLRESLAINQHYDWGWNTLATWGRAIEKPTLAGDFARELAESRREDAWAWLWCARMQRGEEHLPARLAALDQALALDEELLEAVELKLDLLANADRLDEALAFAHERKLPHDKAIKLWCKEARLLLDRDEWQRALTPLERVLAKDPLNRDAWSLKADAASASKDVKLYRLTAHEMVARLPNWSVAHGYYGEALLQAKERGAAKVELAKALELTSDYDFASYLLFDLRMEDKEFEAAAPILANLLDQKGAIPAVVQRQASLAVASGNLAGLTEHFAALGKLPEKEVARFDRVIDGIIERKAAAAATPALQGAFAAADAGAQKPLRLRLMRLYAQEKNWSEAVKLIVADDPEASAVLLRALNAAKEKDTLWRVAREKKHELHRATLTWSLVGHGLGTLRLDKEATAWLADWQTRKDVEPWLLYNLSLALRREKRIEEAFAVNTHAATIQPADHATPVNQLWAAFHAATIGDSLNARQLLKAALAERKELDEHDRLVKQLTETAVAFGDQGADGRAFLATARKLRRVRKWAVGVKNVGFYDREFRAAVQRMGKKAGAPWTWLARIEGFQRLALAVLYLVIMFVAGLAGVLHR